MKEFEIDRESWIAVHFDDRSFPIIMNIFGPKEYSILSAKQFQKQLELAIEEAEKVIK